MNLRFYEKLDGTMIIFTLLYLLFVSHNYRLQKMNIMRKSSSIFKDQKELINYLKQKNVSLIFEYISPNNKIVAIIKI